MATESAWLTRLPCAEEGALIDRWFDQWLEASVSERAALLCSLQRDQPQSHALLLELIEASEQNPAALDPAALNRASAWRILASSSHPSELPLDARIGAWRVIGHLGSGGMGDVYEVERADGAYTQRAALKRLPNELASSDFRERFSRERQILAALDHPGIARLIDGGDDAHGRPYLVMEYVDGARIDHYCDAHRASVRARLELFLRVLDAVAHAHDSRIIHRDLKPSNIAVTQDGGVKLLDFGIAKVVDGDQLQKPNAETLTLMMTPQYSAPEQVLGGVVDERTDIYQLGLLLYELLTTQRAQEPLDGTPRALVDAVCADVPAPSTCVAAAPPERCAMIGAMTAPMLAAQLREDLDWIVLQALRKDATRRYISVRAMADDIRRHLQRLPVRARPETLTYRARRFVQRHRWSVACAAAAFILTIAYAVTMTLQARALSVERDRARTQARTAEQIKALVLTMFEGANPQHALGKELTARELLDTSWPRIEAETRGQPIVQIEILNTMAETYRQLGDYARAEQVLSHARRVSSSHPDLSRDHEAALLLTQGRLATDRGEYERAAQALGRARLLFAQSNTPRSAQLAATLKDLGHLAHRRGRDADAAPLYEQALELYRSAPGDHRREIVDGMERLAVALTQQGDYSRAADMLSQTLALQERLLPEDHPDIAGNVASLAEATRRLGRDAEAEALYRRALSMMRASRGNEHAYVATILNNLARVLIERGQLAEAGPLLEEALSIRRARLGETHELVAMTLNDLGNALERGGSTDAAHEHYQRALEILPADHRWRGALLRNTGRLLEAREDLEGAEQLYRESLQINRARYGDEHDVVAASLQQLGALLLKRGRVEEAEVALQEALRICRLRFDAAHPRTKEVLRLLSRTRLRATARHDP